MSSVRSASVVAAMAAFAAVLAAPAGAAAPVTTPAAPAPPAVAPAPGTPPAGQMSLSPQRVGGRPPFALVGRRIEFRGVIAPYVAGQTVKVSIYRDSHKVGVTVVPVLPLRNGTGQFHVPFTSRYAGLVQARAAHYATAQQGAFDAHARAVRVVNVNLGLGSQGKSVRLLQSQLAALHYAVPLTGSFEEGTGRALVAFRKMTGLQRIPYAGRQVFELLQRGAGQFHVRYRGDGRHVEADLTRQVLAEIEPGGKVRTIYVTSSGKPSTPTVIGRFRVYSKTPGENAKGMVDSNYFIRGYAIHGYAEVPTFAASHGCLRVPVPDAPAIYGWVQDGTPVDVYYEDGGGSARVRTNAGP